VTELGAALPEVAVWRLAGGLVEALQAVHACNLVHRDLKHPTQVATFWHQADVNVMRNAVIVPLDDGQAPFYSSKRVHNKGSSAIIYAPNIGGPDITNVWLNPATP
jgi:peptide/nickel transport system substrate-binding protein